MALRSLSVITRSPSALEAAYTAITSVLSHPAASCISPHPHSSVPGVLASSVAVSSSLSLQLLHIPPSLLPYTWTGSKQVHFVGGNWSASAASDALPLLLAASAQSVQAKVLGLLQQLSLPVGLPLPSPRLELEPSAAAAAGDAPPWQDGQLKEVVLGVEDGGVLSALQGRVSSMATRTPSSLSVWRPRCGTLPLLRLLPSHYSALVFHTASLAALAAAQGEGSSAAAARLELHGQRFGTVGSGNGQLRLRCAALEGLDVRFCEAPTPPPYFSEDEATLTDLMDPALNNVEAKSNSLACKSIVGMDLVSTLKLRMRGRVG
jgi:hypothetical protein